jgi:CDP-diglyceride synthetase
MSETISPDKAFTGFIIFFLLTLVVFAIVLYWDWKRENEGVPHWHKHGDWD